MKNSNNNSLVLFSQESLASKNPDQFLLNSANEKGFFTLARINFWREKVAKSLEELEDMKFYENRYDNFLNNSYENRYAWYLNSQK